MSTYHHNSFEYFQYRSLRLLRDSSERLVSIPTGTDLVGFLAEDRGSKGYAQVRFLKSEDEGIKSAFQSIWNSFLKVKKSDICPQILAITEYDGLPCCISSLPKGEPINHFINRNGDLPPEVAVRLVLEFAKSLRNHSPAFFQNFAISPDSIWISRTVCQPKIVLGEISPVNHPDPEAHNVSLCLNLLKYLTGNTEKNASFQELRRELNSGPGKLGWIERALNFYAEEHPAPNYWMGFNDPASFLERIIASEAASRLAKSKKESVILETAKKTFWPGVIAATLTVGIFITYCLITLANDPDLNYAQIQQVERPVYQRSVPLAPVTIYQRPQQASIPRVQRVVVTPPPAPVVVSAPAPVAARPPVEIVRLEPSTARLPIEGKVTPTLKTLLVGTGELFREMWNRNERSEWLIHGNPEKNQSKSAREAFTAEDEKALKMLELKRAAAEAKSRNLPFEAIKHEVALLKLQPDSLDARIRLHDTLNSVQQMNIEKQEITQEAIDILVEASAENSTAKDILDRHYHKSGS